MSAITRRAVLAGVPAVAAAVAIPGEAANGDEVLLGLEREHRRLVAYCQTIETDAELDYYAARAADIARAIIGTPSRGPSGVAVKIRLWSHYQGEDLDSGPVDDIGIDPILSAHADLERLSGGVS